MSKQHIYQPWNIRKIFCPDCSPDYRVVKHSMPKKEMEVSEEFTITSDLIEFGNGDEKTRFRATRRGRFYVIEIEPRLNGIWHKNGRDYGKIDSVVSLIVSAPFLFIADRNTSQELEQAIAEHYQKSRERKERYEESQRAAAS